MIDLGCFALDNFFAFIYFCFVFFLSLIQSAMEISAMKKKSTSHLNCMLGVLAWMCRIKRDAQKPDALTLISFFAASPFCERNHAHTHMQSRIVRDRLYSLMVSAVSHGTDFYSHRSTDMWTHKCAHVFRPPKQDCFSVVVFFFFLNFLSRFGEAAHTAHWDISNLYFLKTLSLWSLFSAQSSSETAITHSQISNLIFIPFHWIFVVSIRMCISDDSPVCMNEMRNVLMRPHLDYCSLQTQ